MAWGLEREREIDGRVGAGWALQPLSLLSQEAQTQPLTPLFLFLCSRVSLPLPQVSGTKQAKTSLYPRVQSVGWLDAP